MSRRKTPKSRGRNSRAPDTEYTRFAEQFVDLILNPENPWLLHYFFAGGFTYPIKSVKELALDIVEATERDFLTPKDVFDAAMERDREKLVAIVKDHLRQTKPSKENLASILRALHPSVLRGAIREAENIFKLQRGPNPKIPRYKYPELAAWADRLTPIVEKLLTELQSETRRSISDLLEFWKEDYPEACSFLLRHLARFQQALDDPALLKRGTKIKSRARVLADALAGSVTT